MCKDQDARSGSERQFCYRVISETLTRFRLRMPKLRGFCPTASEIFEEVLRPLLFELGLLFAGCMLQNLWPVKQANLHYITRVAYTQFSGYTYTLAT